jgi:hypothetical protein
MDMATWLAPLSTHRDVRTDLSPSGPGDVLTIVKEAIMRIHAARYATWGLTLLALATFTPARAAGQTPTAAATRGDATLTGGVEFLNAYFFRGLRQDDTGLITWPRLAFVLGVYDGTGVVKNVSVMAGSRNSLHTGMAGSDGPSGEPWYESDIRAGVQLILAGAMSVDASYTAYTSPNGMFTTVKEVSFGLAGDERAALGRVPLRPYALVAFELDTAPGVGQADGGFDAGTYLEVGAAPRVTPGALEIAIPVKVGLSLGGYYELAGHDHTFGYFSTAAIVTVPLGPPTKFGAWNVHGGVEYQVLGDMTKAINNGDGSDVIGSIGVGWSR